MEQMDSRKGYVLQADSNFLLLEHYKNIYIYRPFYYYYILLLATGYHHLPRKHNVPFS